MSQDPFGAPPQTRDDDEEISFEIDTKLMPEGLYKAKTLEAKNKTSSNDNKMIMWEFVILEGEYSGTTMVQFTTITPAAIWKVEETCAALGLLTEEPDPVTGKRPVKFRTSEAVNRLCTLEVEHSTYEGRKRESVKTVHAPVEGAGAKWQPQSAVLD